LRRLSIIMAVIVAVLCTGPVLARGAEGKAAAAMVPAAGKAGPAPGAALTGAEAVALAEKLFPRLEGLNLRAEYEENVYEARRVWSIREFWDPYGPSLWSERVWITIDAETGTLLRSEIFLRPPEQVPGRILTHEEALAVAEAFVAATAPAGARALMNLDESYAGYEPKGTLNPVYSFHWTRTAGGIPVVGDGIYVQVDAVTGEVVRYNLEWNPEISLPAPDGVMPAAEITERVLGGLGLVPQYVLSEQSAAGLPEVKLVYALNSRHSFFDAHTGRAVNYWEQDLPLENARLFNRVFSPVQETRAAGVPDGRITPEQGLAAATAFFRALGYEGRVERSGGGSSGGPGYTIETWSYAVVPEGQERRGREPTVEIDTRDGSVAGFFSEDRFSAASGKAGLTYQEACDKALALLRQIEPDLTGRLVMDETSRREPEDGRYSFSFIRLVNGVPFPFQSLTMSISAVDGRLLVDHSNLIPRLAVPAVTGMISTARAEEIFRTRVAPQLIYFPTRTRDGRPTGQAALVYHFPNLGLGIDAHTGALVSAGQSSDGVSAAYEARIGNHWARTPLLLLANSGFLPEPEKCGPGRTISRREGVRLLAAPATRYYGYPEGTVKPPFTDLAADDPDLVYFDRAVRMGLFPGGGAFGPGAPLTREQFAVWLINALGYKEVAGIRGRIESPFKDTQSVTPGLANYVALAGQLGLMGGDTRGNFRPQAGLTWGEAASVIARVLPRLQQAGRI